MTVAITSPWALYNEIDEYAADWLENLIARGVIARGIVDRRSIEDLQADDLRGFRQVHFFAGIGVWSYALRCAGVSDDTALWTGSCPCQPFSAAGKGGGMADERHLWPAFLHLIRECRPPKIYGEQVASSDGLGWIDLVQADLEGSDYACGALDTCSAGFGAPHIRQRLRFAAYDLRSSASRIQHTSRNGRIERRPQSIGRGTASGCCTDGMDDHHHHQGLEGFRRRHSAEVGQREGQIRSTSETSELDGVANDRCEHGVRRQNTEESAQSETREWREDTVHPQPRGSFDGLANNRRVGVRCGQPGNMAETSSESERKDRERERVWIDFEHGGSRSGNTTGSRPGPTNDFWRDADWLFCRDGKWRPVEPGTFPLVDGVAFRVGSGSTFEGRSRQGMLKGYGNAVDAEATREFIEASLELETLDLESVSVSDPHSDQFEDLLG